MKLSHPLFRSFHDPWLSKYAELLIEGFTYTRASTCSTRRLNNFLGNSVRNKRSDFGAFEGVSTAVVIG